MSEDINDKHARSEGFRDNAHRTRVYQGKDIMDGDCMTSMVRGVTVTAILVWAFLRVIR